MSEPPDSTQQQRDVLDQIAALMMLHDLRVWDALSAFNAMQHAKLDGKRLSAAMRKSGELSRRIESELGYEAAAYAAMLVDDGPEPEYTGCWIQVWIKVPNSELPKWKGPSGG